jgi:Domain of unknown function (DUF4184)
MPFTSAHVVAVLPFKKYSTHIFSFTALIIGSIVPDFEYFVRMTLYGHYGHTLLGIIIFDIPLGLLIYIIYNSTVRQAVISYLPNYLFSRVESPIIFDWKFYFRHNFLKILFSLFIGILTHFFWDGFTHDEEYYFARFFTFLLLKITIFNITLPLHFILQLLSTFIGMFILFWHIHFLPHNDKVQIKSNQELLKFWAFVTILAIIIGCIRWAFGMPNEKIIGQFIVVCVSASMLSLIIVSSIYQKKIT